MISKDLTLGQEIVSAPQGGLAEARTWFKRAGQRPAAQEGGGENRVPFVLSLQDTGPMSPALHFTGTALGGCPPGGVAWIPAPALHFQTQCAQ